MKKNDKYLLVFYALLVVGISVGWLYLDSSLEKPVGPLNIVPNLLSNINIIKVVDVETERIFTIMSDVENYPYVLPKNVLSVNKLEETDSSLVYEITFQEKGVQGTVVVRHDLFPYDEQIITVIEGDAKNTVIHQKFQDQDDSTKLITDIEINLSGILAPFQLTPQHNFRHGMDTILSEFVIYSLEKTKNEKIVDDLYRDILKRPVDQEGLDYFTALLEKNEITPELIRSTLYTSEEYIDSLPINLKNLDELTDETKNTIDELYEITLRRGADDAGMKYFGTLLENEKLTEVDIITELLTSSEFDSLPTESRSFDAISEDNIDMVKTIYFEITEKDEIAIIASINKALATQLETGEFCSIGSQNLGEIATCSDEEEYLKMKNMGILLWIYQDKLIYALSNFLEDEIMTIDEIKEFLLNNPEM